MYVRTTSRLYEKMFSISASSQNIVAKVYSIWLGARAYIYKAYCTTTVQYDVYKQSRQI
jgi:hypothetical protein